MTRLRGRAPRGERVQASCPHGHWHTRTMISSIPLDGSSACMAIEGATDTEVFRAYVRRVLRPRLRTGDVVIMDNLAPHKNEITLSLIEQAGATVLFLPAYSPDLNPIEKMWSKLKQSLRSAEARTRQELLKAIASTLQTVTPKDARGWFASCGYSYLICSNVAIRVQVCLCALPRVQRQPRGETIVPCTTPTGFSSPSGLLALPLRSSWSRSVRRGCADGNLTGSLSASC